MTGTRCRGRVVGGLAGLLATIALVGAQPACADVFGPISLASVGALAAGSQLQQAEQAHDPAISGDGRYVAFDGAVGGIEGVWRSDLITGALEQVAGGAAELPSISEDGRYVSFTTNEGAALAEDTDGRPHAPRREAVNVYVRDMTLAPQAAGAFLAASARDGSGEPLSYSEAGATRGSSAVGRSAISADGNEVAFVTTAVSNLIEGTAAEPATPPFQVAVRYLSSRQTMLVSGEYEPLSGQTTGQPVSFQEGGLTFGAVYPGNAPSFGPPPANGKWGKNPPPGASISADGSTVVWMGEDIDRQARMLPDETRPPLYTEPLWRRIAPGSQTPTERVTGGSDPLDPACIAGGERRLPTPSSPSDPCQGPFEVTNETSNRSSGIWTQGGTAQAEGDFVPRLSADGYAVAFISGAVPTALGGGFGNTEAGEPADLYVADMHPGLTRDQALTPLTELAAAETIAGADPITDFDISPDGTQVAFAARRTEFPLGSPAYISEPSPEPGLSELFDVDLANHTLTRVTHGYEGGAPKQAPIGSKVECPEDVFCQELTIGSQSPSFSSDSRMLAFASTAANLVFGDGNTPPAGPFDGSDAFVDEREVFTPQPTPNSISPPPITIPTPEWRLDATASPRRDGSVVLYITAPAAGTVTAAARSGIRVVSSARVASRRRPSAIVTRAVATAHRSIAASEDEPTTLTLRLASRYLPLATRRGGLSAVVTVTFTAAGHVPLHASLTTTFRRVAAGARSSRRRSAHGRVKGRGR